MRKKRLLTYSLAFAMAISMAAPQAAVLPASLKAVNVYAAEAESEVKATPQVTQVEFTEKENHPCIRFAELNKYADDTSFAAYASALSKVVVNNQEYEVYYGQLNSYDLSWSTGFSVLPESIASGEYTIILSAKGYQDKKIVVSVDTNEKTASIVSQEDVDPGDVAIDKTELANTISAAEGYDLENATEEKKQALQAAIDDAKEVYNNENATQKEIDDAVTALNEAIDAFNKKDPENTTVENPVEDGEYTLTYTVEDTMGGSMIGGTIDKRVKLSVENGKMKLSVLNVALQDSLIDLSVGSNGNYKSAEVKDYGAENKNYKEFTMDIDDITQNVTIAVLVDAMGGQSSNKGNWSKYSTAAITFSSIKKGWDGYAVDESNDTDADVLVMNALIANYPYVDENENGVIDADEWTKLPSTIDLSNAGLTDVSILKNLPSTVTDIDLSYNDITEIPEDLLAGKTELTQFVLNGNYISTIPAGLFKDSKKLVNIYMSNMNLSKVEAGTFAGLSELEQLDLQSNKITDIEAGAFDGLTKLTQLGLDTNKLSSLPDNLFESLTSLTFCGLSENEFSRIPKTVEQLSAVESLYLNWNKLISVDDISFGKLGNLKILQLAWNEITSLPSGMLAQNKNLESVDLYDNRITSVSADMFPKTAEGLTKLDLQLNEMNLVDPAIDKLTQGYNKQNPQKTVLNFKAAQSGDKKIKWNQTLSVLDLMLWREETVSDKKSEIKDITAYKELLHDTYNDKNVVDILNDQSFDWDITTELQKKNADNTYTTVSTDTSSDLDDILSGAYKVESNGTYRVKKKVKYGPNKAKTLSFTVYSNDVTVKDSSKQDSNSTTQKKPQTTTQKKQNTTKVKVAKVKSLKAKNLSGKKVRVSWKKVNGASGYKVYRATKKNGKYTLVKTIKNAKTVKFTDKKVKKNKTYYYKVSAYKKVAKKVVKGTYSAKAKVRVKR